MVFAPQGKHTLSHRVFVTIFVCAMAVIVAFTVLGAFFVQNTLADATSANLAQETELIAAALDEQQEPIPFLRSLDREDLRITLINKDGSVAYDNEASPSTLPNHGDRPEVIEPLRVVRVPRSAQALHSTRLCCIAPSPLITARSFAWRRPSLALRRFCCRCWRDAAYRSSGCSTLVFYGARESRAIIAPLQEVDLDHPRRSYEHAYARWSPCLSVSSRSARNSSAKWRC